MDSLVNLKQKTMTIKFYVFTTKLLSCFADSNTPYTSIRISANSLNNLTTRYNLFIPSSYNRQQQGFSPLAAQCPKGITKQDLNRLNR